MVVPSIDTTMIEFGTKRKQCSGAMMGCDCEINWCRNHKMVTHFMCGSMGTNRSNDLNYLRISRTDSHIATHSLARISHERERGNEVTPQLLHKWVPAFGQISGLVTNLRPQLSTTLWYVRMKIQQSLHASEVSTQPAVRPSMFWDSLGSPHATSLVRPWSYQQLHESVPSTKMYLYTHKRIYMHVTFTKSYEHVTIE